MQKITVSTLRLPLSRCRHHFQQHSDTASLRQCTMPLGQNGSAQDASAHGGHHLQSPPSSAPAPRLSRYRAIIASSEGASFSRGRLNPATCFTLELDGEGRGARGEGLAGPAREAAVVQHLRQGPTSAEQHGAHTSRCAPRTPPHAGLAPFDIARSVLRRS